MGHERLGCLPRTRRWRAIVEEIASSQQGDEKSIADLARRTLENVEDRFARIHKDKGVQAAFGYLVALASSHLPRKAGLASPGIQLSENPSPIRIAKQLNDWIRRHGDSMEYAEVASRAGADAIADWTKTQTQQGTLFDDTISAKSVWTESASAGGFCQVAKSFFAHFTERYIRYFLEREASSQMASVAAREDLSRRLHEHVSDVSKHAFETSKITQSFAAGWYNNHARDSRPSDREVEGFLAIAFGKLSEELRREAKE